jgi:hypothetical protein
VVTPFFPPDVYQTLLNCLPPARAYEDFAYKKHSNPDGQSNRQRFRLEHCSLTQLEPKQRILWTTIRNALGNTAVKEAVFDKLSQGLAYRFHCQPCEVNEKIAGFALPELFRETEGYVIAPHPDTRRKVVTMQIALAEDERQGELGTELYRRSVSPLSWLREPRGFEIVKRMPFLPNTAYAFVVLNTLRIKSWHGRCRLPASAGVRNSLLNIWYAKAEDANAEIAAENQRLSRKQRAA